jgi:hypothetical protein
VNGSRTIRVIKRDGREEAFDAAKLAGAIYRAMQHAEGSFHDAGQLAAAIEHHLARAGVKRITSTAIMEMALKVLGQVCMSPAAMSMDAYRAWRAWRRRQIRIWHEGGEATLCDKGWLSELVSHGWAVSQRAGRIIAAQVERELLAGESCEFRRQEVQDMINRHVAEFGLADAVPIELNAQPI